MLTCAITTTRNNEGISLLTGYAEPVANISTAALANGCPATDYDHASILKLFFFSFFFCFFPFLFFGGIKLTFFVFDYFSGFLTCACNVLLFCCILRRTRCCIGVLYDPLSKVMNGIAVDNPQATGNQRLYLTGKYWTKVLVVSINKSNLLSQLHGANK